MKIFLLFLVVHSMKAQFLLDEINMNDRTFEACQLCDARADRAGTRATANAVRRHLSKNYIKIVVDEGDVYVRDTFPNEKVDTGYSCKYTAEARNIAAEARMVPGTVKLDAQLVLQSDEEINSIAVGEVEHALTADVDIRVWYGVKVFGTCGNIWRKTCSTVGKSKGINKISANFAGSNTLVECIGGQEHITFNVDVTVIDEAINKTYAPVTVDRRDDCDLEIFDLKIGSINNIIQNYATRYVDRDENRFRELRGPKLVAELEKKIGVKLGSLVAIKVNDENGNPRTCSSRRKRAAGCVRKSCPPGFTRVGDSDKCQKFFGMSKPNCKQYGSKAELVTQQPSPSIQLHYCYTPMQ